MLPPALGRGPGGPTPAFGFQVRSDRDKFVIFLDVKHFSPEDLTVKVQEDFVEIHGKHNERQVRAGARPAGQPCGRAPAPPGGDACPPMCSCLPVTVGGGSWVLSRAGAVPALSKQPV